MGEIADSLISGAFCQTCGQYIGEECGYPRSCTSCGGRGEPFAKAIRQQRAFDEMDSIRSLSKQGFTVKEFNNGYQIRINDRLDLYPVRRRFHDIKTGQRGNYKDVSAFVMKFQFK